jgi:hypothetical protein
MLDVNSDLSGDVTEVRPERPRRHSLQDLRLGVFPVDGTKKKLPI